MPRRNLRNIELGKKNVYLSAMLNCQTKNYNYYAFVIRE